MRGDDGKALTLSVGGRTLRSRHLAVRHIKKKKKIVAVVDIEWTLSRVGGRLSDARLPLRARCCALLL